ncbi:MAG: SDR family NAD(P)-dependent oxidoreductase, partial [Chloroflexota bacterium]
MLIEGSALITGASRGIGRVIAMRLAAQGLAIGVNYRERHSEAESVVEAIQSAGGKAVAIQADVASDDEVAGLVDRAEEALGPLSIVVNNAGITRDRLLIQMSEADWLDIWRTDLAGTRTVCRAAEKRMVPRRAGRIINVSSVVGTGGNAGQANYAAAKAAVLGLTREFAVRCAPSGVTVNCVVPGYIDTDAT